MRSCPSSDGEAYTLYHIPWCAAVEIGLAREPDRNRFITVETGELDNFELKIPPDEYLFDLGQKMLSIALMFVHRARKMANQLKATDVPGIDRRVIEAYSVLAAMLAGIWNFDREKAIACLRLLLGNVDRRDQGQKDHDDLLDDIMGSKVDCGQGVRLSVQQIVFDKEALCEHLTALESNGISLVNASPGRRGTDSHADNLFLAVKMVRRNLLTGTDWENQQIDQILTRVPGADKGRHPVGPARQRGVRIPLDYLNQRYN